MELKKLIKKSTILSPIIYGVRRLYYKSLIKKYGKEPIKRTSILFSNFNGRGYGCNPKAIADEMHKQRPDFELLWVCDSDVSKESLPPYVTPVTFLSKEYFKAVATAGTWVFNLTLQDYLIKRKEQFYIQTWHGDRAFKKVLHDAEELSSFKKWMHNVKLREDALCDCCMSASDFGTKVYRSSFLYNGWVMEVGQPRNDILLHKDQLFVQRIKAKLNIADDVKILLYAPTFRDHLESHEKSNSNIQLDRIIEELEKKTRSKWVVLLRAHSGSKLTFINNNNMHAYMDVTTYPDMADLLAVTDFLITDYSSCAPDFALTGNPILLYQDDINDYVNKDRTMWFRMDESPYLSANNMDEAIALIRSITPEEARRNDNAILSFYGTKESGEASKLICEEIIRRSKNVCMKQ